MGARGRSTVRPTAVGIPSTARRDPTAAGGSSLAAAAAVALAVAGVALVPIAITGSSGAGDSSAAGYGVHRPRETPGALIAAGTSRRDGRSRRR